MFLDELKQGQAPIIGSRYPFSFVYGGKLSDALLDTWTRKQTELTGKGGIKRSTVTWEDEKTGLKVIMECRQFTRYNAAEWLLYFENSGSKNTPIIQNIKALDITLNNARKDGDPYILHKTRGGTPDPMHFEPAVVGINRDNPQRAAAAAGRSSTMNFPFFKIETGDGAVVGAIGWSGNWIADFECPDDKTLRVSAGMALTHFRLLPGEKVRTPRVVLLETKGDPWKANAVFRQLIFEHYCLKRNSKTPLPTAFCNTCFTRGGGWLNECNAENQISLIRAYAPLGLEALITDAGWFTGGWPNGAGNWDPRKDAYPDGMAPVAEAAKNNGLIYGLWFEPERVMKGTDIQKRHPEWCLKSSADNDSTFLLNFGLSEVQDYFFDIVKGFMDLPGFRFYRQDFNMDPLPFWQFNDAKDRQGITEIKYTEGIYAYWERISETWPDSMMEECAGGGHRFDLETIMHFHLHQKTDYWFNNEVDQAALWSLSQYVPSNTVVSHLIRLDDYSFHSNLASSMCLGWIADDPGFDAKRGKALLKRYHQVKHYLVGSWYPLLGYSRAMDGWTGSQYHRDDLNEGLLLLFRRPDSPYRTVDIKLKGLDKKTKYQLKSDSGYIKITATGEQLMKGIQVSIADKHRSELVVYKKAK